LIYRDLCYTKFGDKMRYLKEPVIEEIEIHKSVFITHSYPLNHLEELNVYLNETKQLYPKANH